MLVILTGYWPDPVEPSWQSRFDIEAETMERIGADE